LLEGLCSHGSRIQKEGRRKGDYKRLEKEKKKEEDKTTEGKGRQKRRKRVTSSWNKENKDSRPSASQGAPRGVAPLILEWACCRCVRYDMFHFQSWKPWTNMTLLCLLHFICRSRDSNILQDFGNPHSYLHVPPTNYSCTPIFCFPLLSFLNNFILLFIYFI